MTSNAQKFNKTETQMITKDGNVELACGVSWPALALTRIRRVATSSLVVPKPRSVICVRARNSSVTMSAALWEIGDPNTLMKTQTGTMNGQAARPPCAREAVAAELGTIRERVFEARERMMSSERKIEGTLSGALSPGADYPEIILWRLEAMQQRLEMRMLLTNAASSARARFGIHLDHGFSDDEVEVVDMWLALLRRPMLVHPAEATACDIRTWLDPLSTVHDIYAFDLVESSSAAVTQQSLSMIPAVAVTTTAGFTGSLCHANATTTDKIKCRSLGQPHRSTEQAFILAARRRRACFRPLSLPLPPPSTPPPYPLAASSLCPDVVLSLSRTRQA